MPNDLVTPTIALLDRALESADDEDVRHHIREAQQLIRGIDELAEAPTSRKRP